MRAGVVRRAPDAGGSICAARLRAVEPGARRIMMPRCSAASHRRAAAAASPSRSEPARNIFCCRRVPSGGVQETCGGPAAAGCSTRRWR